MPKGQQELIRLIILEIFKISYRKRRGISHGSFGLDALNHIGIMNMVLVRDLVEKIKL